LDLAVETFDLTMSVIFLVAVYLLGLLPTVHSFGTYGVQGNQHEYITRNALACKDGEKSNADGDCFEARSINSLAGAFLATGAVGAPDASLDIFESEPHCDGGDWFDYAKYPIPGAKPYGQTETEAKAALGKCITYLTGKRGDGVREAKKMLAADGSVIEDQTSLVTEVNGAPQESQCKYAFHLPGRAKCAAFDGIGRSLHGVQDFYAHSNWVDQVGDGSPTTPDNPPGLGQTGLVPFLSLDGSTVNIPPGLITGCFKSTTLDPKTGVKGCLAMNRTVVHENLNKDDGTISLVPGVTFPPATPITSNPKTARGKIGSNFETAVQLAILETRRQWNLIRETILRENSQEQGKRIICALTHDEPWKDCNRRIAVAVDSSGSNLQTDPSNLRVSAAKQLVSSLSANDQVAIIDFDSIARVSYPLGPPSGATYGGIDSSGGTSIASGINLALDTLTFDNNNATHARSGIVVLTDGMDGSGAQYGQAVQRAADLGIRLSQGFLNPPAVPVAKRDTWLGRLSPRQAAAADPLGGMNPDVVMAVLRTGGTVGIISSATAQARFVSQVVANGLTHADDPGSIAREFFLNVTATALVKPTSATYVFKTPTAAGAKFTISLIKGASVSIGVHTKDVASGAETQHVIAPAQNWVFDYAGANLEVVVSTASTAGTGSSLYTIQVVPATSPPTNSTTSAPPANSTSTSMAVSTSMTSNTTTPPATSPPPTTVIPSTTAIPTVSPSPTPSPTPSPKPTSSACRLANNRCSWPGQVQCCGDRGMVVCSRRRRWQYSPCRRRGACRYRGWGWWRYPYCTK
jgi:hypothetical protein